jgi:hypothetical protein
MSPLSFGHKEIGTMTRINRRHPRRSLRKMRLGAFCVAATVATCLVAGVGADAASAAFSISSFQAQALNADQSVDMQAGSHPYTATTNFELGTVAEPTGVFPDENVKNIVVELPAGFVGDPAAMQSCSSYAITSDQAGCPLGSQVGYITLTADIFGFPNTTTFGVYNMQRKPGETAAFGFDVNGVVIHISLKPRTDSDYGITATIANAPETIPIVASNLVLWGVPADPRHDAQRARALICFGDPLEAESCQFYGSDGADGGHPAGVAERPFLTNPTLCGAPLTTTMRADSWQHPDAWHEMRSTTVGPITGCDKLPSFQPSLSLQPDTAQIGSPTGLSVKLSVPQSENPVGLATPTLRKAVITLPAGISISPSSAGGLGACTNNQIGIGTTNPVACPQNSKIGDVTVETPLLAAPLTGSVFLGSQESNDPASGRMFRVFLDAENTDYGLSIRLEGNLSVDPRTGQVTATFDNNPQLPFSNLLVRLKSGPRAPLVTPSICGTYTTSAVFTPWAARDAASASASDSFTVSADGNGAPCPAAPPFAPSFSAGTVNPLAGAFSQFSLTLSRSDQDQNLRGIQVKMPPGLLGKLAGVPLCGEAQANAGTCSAASQIGTTTVSAGPGSNPVYLPVSGQPENPVYLTTGYKGAPFGLSVVVPAIAGPFNLGNVVVRAAINVDPHTAQVTVVSDPLPTILQGIPLDLRMVNVTIDRPGFMFNPTNCSALSVDGTVTSTQGAAAVVSSHFQAANCASLPFKPRFTVLTQARTSRANGAYLHVKVTSGAGQANIGKVKVDLPKQLPSRLTTLQKACPDAVFNANPASCPAGSLVGEGTALTPILASALRGPAYLVSHAGAAFPDLVIVLQGEGITLDLVGNTDIKKGITISTFNTVPDAPISSFDLVLPEGPHSALAAFGNLCKTHLNMPTLLTGQNGALVKQTTRIAVTGCPKAEKHGKVPHGRKHKKN